MKHFKLAFLLIAILFLAFPQHGFAKDTKNVGKIANVSGTVELQKGGGKKQFKAVQNMSVTQGDTISTGAKSKAVLHIDGDKEVTIAANTKLVIKQLVKSINAEQGKTQLSLLGGKVKVKINKKLQGDSKFQVQTPNAIMGVMGTEFDVAYDGEQTKVLVNEGVVHVSTTSTPDTQEYDVSAQQVTTINSDGSTPPQPTTDADHAFFTSDSDLSQDPTDNEQNSGSPQAIQYGPSTASTNDDDDRSTSSGSSSGNTNNNGINPTPPGGSGNSTDPGQTTDPGNSTDPGQTTDPGNSTPTEQERGFSEGTAAKELYLRGVQTADGEYAAFDEIIEQNATHSQAYQDGYSIGMEAAYNYTGDPSSDYTAGYDIGYAEQFIEGYLTSYEMTHGEAPAFASYAVEDLVLFYEYYQTIPSDSDFDIGFLEGLASIDEREFPTSPEGIQIYDDAYNARHATLSALDLDGIRAFGEEDGYVSSSFSLGYEQGYQYGGEAGRAAGEASTP